MSSCLNGPKSQGNTLFNLCHKESKQSRSKRAGANPAWDAKKVAMFVIQSLLKLHRLHSVWREREQKEEMSHCII